MLPIKKILCPIDFSEFSYEALGNAKELATHFRAELCLLHVAQVVPYTTAPYALEIVWDEAAYEKAVREGAKHELKKAVIRAQAPEIQVTSLIREGPPTDQILCVAKDEQVDLIVIATHGLSGWRHLVFGSVAEKVIRLSTCPVLVTHIRKP